MFEASGRVIVTSPHDRTLFRNERGVPFVDMVRYLDTQADQLTSPDVIARAAELLEGRFQPRQLQTLVEAESSPTTFALTVRARHEEPATAADVVNAVIQAYQDVEAAQVQAQTEASVAQLAALQADIQQRLDALNAEQGSDPGAQAERDRLSNELAELQTRAGQVRVDAAVYGAGIERTEPAVIPEQPASETARRMAALFGLLGFLAALIVAFWRSERTQIIESPDDAAAAVDAPLVGVLSTRQARTLTAAATVVTAPGSSQAREHQIIASKVALLGGDSDPRVVLVTSPEGTPGKSVTALNLALSAALDHRAVILADVDAAGRLTHLLGADDKSGVSDLVARSTDGDVADCVAAVEELSAVDGFRFIPVGTAADRGGRGITATPQLAKLLARLLQETDLIVLDGPPLLRAPTATRLAADTDGVVVIVVDRGTRSEDLRKAAGLVQLAKASLVGYVFDRSRRPSRWLPWRRHARSADGRPAT
jgi:Mrp family chromosome partitioning ATPase